MSDEVRVSMSFEHSEQVVVRKYRFAGQLMARPVRELTAIGSLPDGRRFTSTMDLPPTDSEVVVAYHRRILERSLVMQADTDTYRRRQTNKVRR